MFKILKNLGTLILLLLISNYSYSHDSEKVDKLIASNILGTVSSLVAPPYISAVISLVPYISSEEEEKDVFPEQDKFVVQNLEISQIEILNNNSSFRHINSIKYTNSLN